MVGGATIPPWCVFAAASASQWMGLASPMASHHWRIIASFTGSRAISGGPKS
jgi:hypothetical protein